MPTKSFDTPVEAIHFLANQVDGLEAKLNAQMAINTVLITAIEASGILPEGKVGQICRDFAQSIESKTENPDAARKVRNALEEQFSAFGISAEIIQGKFAQAKADLNTSDKGESEIE